MCNACRSAAGLGLVEIQVVNYANTQLLSDRKGEGLQCPDCGEKDLGCRLVVAESLLPTELQEGPRPCPFKESGCTALLGAGQRTRHAASCLFRPVRCPKAIFSSSCLYKGPYCTIQVLFFCSVELAIPFSSLESWEVKAWLSEGYHQLGAWSDNIQDV